MYEDLTPTERSVYNYILKQENKTVTAQEIAQRMNYNSTSTVRDHISSIRGKGMEIDYVRTDSYIVTD